MSEKEVVAGNDGGLALKSLVPDEVLQEEGVRSARSSFDAEEMAGLYSNLEQVREELLEPELPAGEGGVQKYVASGHFFTDHSVIMNDAGPQGSISGVDSHIQGFVAQGEAELSVMMLGEDGEDEQGEEDGFGSDDFIDAIVQSITQTVAGYEAVVVVEEAPAPAPDPVPAVPNVAPVAQNDDFSGNQGVVINGNVLDDNGNGADTDADGGTLSVVAGTFDTDNNGTIVVAEDGSFTYTPDAGYSGVDSYIYTVEDGQGGSDTAAVYFTLNAAPVAQDDAFSSNEGLLITGNVLDDNGSGADADADGGTLSVVAGTFDTDNDGVITISEDGSFIYTPITGYSGADSYTYTVEDGQGGSDTATVVFTLNDAANISGNDLDNFLMGDEEGPAGDVIDGDGGDDTLVGGEGADILTGGSGSDTFSFWTTEEGLYDIITDFTRNDAEEDVLELADMLGAYDPVTDAIIDFLLVTDDGTDTYVSADMDGGGDNFVLFACLEGITGLTVYSVQGLNPPGPDDGPPPASPV